MNQWVSALTVIVPWYAKIALSTTGALGRDDWPLLRKLRSSLELRRDTVKIPTQSEVSGCIEPSVTLELLTRIFSGLSLYTNPYPPQIMTCSRCDGRGDDPEGHNSATCNAEIHICGGDCGGKKFVNNYPGFTQHQDTCKNSWGEYMTNECWVCDKEFDTESALSQHLSAAGHYQCYKCERTFGDSTALGQHIDACHE